MLAAIVAAVAAVVIGRQLARFIVTSPQPAVVPLAHPALEAFIVGVVTANPITAIRDLLTIASSAHPVCAWLCAHDGGIGP